jgi:hypothetical protein
VEVLYLKRDPLERLESLLLSFHHIPSLSPNDLRIRVDHVTKEYIRSQTERLTFLRFLARREDTLGQTAARLLADYGQEP